MSAKATVELGELAHAVAVNFARYKSFAAEDSTSSEGLHEAAGWLASQGFVATGYKEIAAFSRALEGPVGGEVSVYCDQAVLPERGELGLRDRRMKRYFGARGLRLDITLRVRTSGGDVNCAVFEIKLSEDTARLGDGLEEAIIYHHEYAPYLRGCPNAVLITSKLVDDLPQRDDDVVAMNWEALRTSLVVGGLPGRVASGATFTSESGLTETRGADVLS